MLKNYQEVLEYAFEVLNKIYFENALPPIVITIMSSPKTNGHFTVHREWRVGEENYNEINISAEHLDRPIANVIATLQHELIHYYCQLNNIQDTSQYGRYHNKNFKIEAEKRGLSIGKLQGIGWSLTEPTIEFIDVLRAHQIEKPIDINRDGYHSFIPRGADNGTSGTDGAVTTTPKKPKCSTRKYQCPNCKNSFRATKEINVLCIDCNEEFILIEKG